MTLPVGFERCPDCGVELLKQEQDSLSHRYIGASPSCWVLFSNLVNADEPPLTPARLNSLIVDAYLAQHHGTPSPQAIQSVAVHLLVLYGVLNQGLEPERALWIRQRALREMVRPKHSRFHWLTPPDFAGCLTIVNIVQASTPDARANKAREFIEQIWSLWADNHLATLSQWYAMYVVSEK